MCVLTRVYATLKCSCVKQIIVMNYASPSQSLLWGMTNEAIRDVAGRRPKKTGTVTTSSIAKRAREIAVAVRRRSLLFVVRFGCVGICSR